MDVFIFYQFVGVIIGDVMALRIVPKQVNEVRQVYNSYVANPDLPNIVSDITELSSQLDAYLQQACLEFQTQSNR